MKKNNIIKTLQSVNGKWIRSCHFQSANQEQTNTTSFFIADNDYQCTQNEYEMQPEFEQYSKEQLIQLLNIIIRTAKYSHQICGESTDTFGNDAGTTFYWIGNY